MKRISTLIFVYFAIALFSNSTLKAVWVDANSCIYGGDILSLAFSGENLYVVTTTGGVFLSTDNGDNWVERNSGLNNTNVYSLAIKDNTVFLGNRYTIFRAELSDFGITDVKDSHFPNSLAFIISPNPATENIRVSLQGELQNADIKITNSQGNVFYENSYALLTKELPIEIDTKELPTGVYFCTINSGNYIATQKFIVIR